MGTKVKTQVGLASALFSQVQLRLLSLLIGQPNRAFHTSEIIALARSGTGAVLRELTKLAKAGIIESRSEGNRKIYQANRQSPIFKELHRIILKTTGLVEPIRRSLKSFHDRIRFAFVYGSVAKGTETAHSDVDVMIVGEDLSYSEVFGALQIAEKAINRPINPNIMTPAEWKRSPSGNSFLKSVAEGPKLFIFGSEHELKRT